MRGHGLQLDQRPALAPRNVANEVLEGRVDLLVEEGRLAAGHREYDVIVDTLSHSVRPDSHTLAEFTWATALPRAALTECGAGGTAMRPFSHAGANRISPAASGQEATPRTPYLRQPEHLQVGRRLHDEAPFDAPLLARFQAQLPGELFQPRALARRRPQIEHLELDALVAWHREVILDDDTLRHRGAVADRHTLAKGDPTHASLPQAALVRCTLDQLALDGHVVVHAEIERELVVLRRQIEPGRSRVFLTRRRGLKDVQLAGQQHLTARVARACAQVRPLRQRRHRHIIQR